MVGTPILEFTFDSTFIVASPGPWNVPGVSGIKEMTYNQRNEAFEKGTYYLNTAEYSNE